MHLIFDVITGVSSNNPSPPDPVPLPPYNETIDRETSRRLSLPFTFNGKLYDRDPTSLQRITGAGSLAGFAVASGSQVGDYRWHGGSTDFSWIANDNSINLMDAQTMFTFSKAAAAVESHLIFRGRSLKDNPVPIQQVYLDATWE